MEIKGKKSDRGVVVTTVRKSLKIDSKYEYVQWIIRWLETFLPGLTPKEKLFVETAVFEKSLDLSFIKEKAGFASDRVVKEIHRSLRQKGWIVKERLSPVFDIDKHKNVNFSIEVGYEAAK
jgi:hypothetical protein